MTTRLLVDALGRSVPVLPSPQRIVSLVPSLTEWLFAIGLGDRVVGVTDYCVQPSVGEAGAALKTKRRLRGTKNPDRAAIIALQPDIILANKEENRERDVQALAAAGLAVYVSDPRTVSDAIALLAELAGIFGVQAAAQPYIRAMRTAQQEVAARPLPRPRVLVPIWRDPWMAIGDDTYANDLLQFCGGLNVAAELAGRYPRFELELIERLRPDLILLPSEPYRFTPADLPALLSVWAGPCRFVDGELLTWYGPRLAQALRTFASLLQSFGAPPSSAGNEAAGG